MPRHHAHASRTARRGVPSAYTRHDALSCGNPQTPPGVARATRVRPPSPRGGPRSPCAPAPWNWISDPVEGAVHVSGVGPIFGKPAFEETSEPLVPAQVLSRIYGISFRRARAVGRHPEFGQEFFFPARADSRRPHHGVGR